MDEGNADLSESENNVLLATRKALSEARARQEAIEKERDKLLEELVRSNAKQQEYIDAIKHDKEVAIVELEAAKALFNQKLEHSVEEKFNLESKLVLAKKDAVELAVQVEKLADIAFQQVTSHILQDAQLKVSAAETSAAEAAYHIEEQIRLATEDTIVSVVEQSKDAIDKALAVAESAGEQTTKAFAVLTDDMIPFDEIASVNSENIKLRNVVNDLKAKLSIASNNINKLQLDLEQARKQASTFELRASDFEKAFLELQETSREEALQQEEEIKLLLEKFKKESAEKRRAASKAFKVELEAIKAAIGAAKATTRSKDEAYMRRCEALTRSLKASETVSRMWRERAEITEALLLKQNSVEDDQETTVYTVNGGRVELLMDADSQKWRLLSEGPRREIPEWMARRIHSIFPKFPPRKTGVSEVASSKFVPLDLPKPDEVWSIAQEKPKEGDTLVEHVIEKEVIEKKRKALERALQRKTIKWKRTPEEKKLGVIICSKSCYLLVLFLILILQQPKGKLTILFLLPAEPGTGTGREIVVSIILGMFKIFS